MISGRVPVWLWPNLLSLDAPVVAVLWQGFIADSLHIQIAWPARITLALAVWAVYIADRLLDTAREGKFTPAPRHRFHREHRKLMTGFLVLAITCAASLSLLQVRPALFRAGLLTGTIVILYLAAVHRHTSAAAPCWISKEASVALVFTGGAILAPFLRSESKTALLLGGGALFLVCWGNLSLIEAFEWRRLQLAEGTPPNRWTSAIADNFALYFLFIAGYVAFAATLWSNLHPVLFATLIAAIGLWVLTRMQSRLSASAFRVLADTALLSPVCIWPFLPQ